MYCKKCGKFIGNDSDFCDECSAKEAEVFGEFFDAKKETPPAYDCASHSTYSDGNQVSLGKAIAAVVLSDVGFAFIYLALVLMGATIVLEDYASVIVCMLIGLVTSVLGLIFGIKAIKHFKETSNIRSGKRIPVLVLGILSVVTAGIGLFLAFFIFCVLSLV